MNIIELNKLTKCYGKHRGIIDVDLSIKEGEYFGFIGPNGAGKSTSIRTLLGLISAGSGSATLFGKPIGNPDLLSDIGYLPSEALFYDNMKVRDIIAYSAKLYKKDCKAEASSLCDRLKLDTSKRISELSLGNRKKVGIVCAMQHNPKLYILDEPTSGLDPLMQKEFFDLLRERNNEGATVFLSSHILREVQRNCSRAAIIKEGKIIACDSVDNLARSNARRVSIEGINTLPTGISGKSIQAFDNSISFLYNGNIRELLQALVALPIDDVTITEPELDEIFMHYYEGTEA